MITIQNATAVPRPNVPVLTIPALHQEVVEACSAGARIAAWFYVPDEIWCVLADPAAGALRIARANVEGKAVPSLTPQVPAMHLFEREIAEQWGVQPVGHPWLKPVRFPGGSVGVMDWYRVEGSEVHEVAVGPVHAGVIEPGHFRFQCHGEEVLHLEISLGYQHRGVERAMVGGPTKRTLHYVETLAGDTTIGHALAYCELIEALTDADVPARARALRGVALELERLANHTGDLGAIAGDVGYLPTASYCGRLRGDWLNLTAELCGNRFGRSFVVPGGVAFRVEADRVERIMQRVRTAAADLAPVIRLLWDTTAVMSRLEEIGKVERSVAREIGLVGLAARACGLEVDARIEFPTGIYRTVQLPISMAPNGDVHARASVRADEIERSAEFVQDVLSRLPSGPGLVETGSIRANHVAVDVVEGWRGEICHVALTDEDGHLAAYKVVDPSFHNWMGLAMAMRGQQVSDFPLCNKSFNLSYCGVDL